MALSDSMHRKKHKGAGVVLASYRRPFNIETIARAALECASVERLIVSNHNPDVNIHAWLGIDDTRLAVVNATKRQWCGYRWRVAFGMESDAILVIDDDVLMESCQIEQLITELETDPETVHGYFGSLRVRGRPNPMQYLECEETEVDQVHRVYAVSKCTLERYFCTLRELYRVDRMLAAVAHAIGDDVLVSHAGNRRPRIHNLGTVQTCATRDSTAYATDALPGFHEARAALLDF